VNPCRRKEDEGENDARETETHDPEETKIPLISCVIKCPELFDLEVGSETSCGLPQPPCETRWNHRTDPKRQARVFEGPRCHRVVGPQPWSVRSDFVDDPDDLVPGSRFSIGLTLQAEIAQPVAQRT